MRRRVVFIIGSPFSGSTYLSHLLAAMREVTVIGEAQRLRRFGQFAHAEDHYLDGCSVCSTHINYDCPVWTSELIENIEDPSAASYKDLLSACDTEVIVDGSKEIDWLSFLVANGSVDDVSAIVLSRTPFQFIDSNRKRLPNFDITWHAEGWRNTYTHSLRSLAFLGIPYAILRYDRFVEDADYLSQFVSRFLPEVVAKPVRDRNSSIFNRIHPLGGNLSEMSRLPGFDKDIFKKQSIDFMPAEISFDVQRVLSGSATLPEHSGRRLIDDHWTFADVMGVLSLPGMIEICQHLGYTLDGLVRSVRQST